jgi:hypothetical protein
MYCSSCGVAVANELPYCNYCGAKLNRGDTAKSSEVRPEGLVMMMVATFVMGTFVITLLMGMMKVVLRFESGLIMAIMLLFFLVMLVLEAVFIRLLLRGQKAPPTTLDGKRQQHPGMTKELEAESRVPLEPVASVTEHTTRAFTPVYGKEK